MAKSKRRVAAFRTKPLSARGPELSEQSITRIIDAVGIEIVAEKRAQLRDQLREAFDLLTAFDIALNKLPAAWEIKQNFKAIHASASSIWKNLGISKTPAEAWTGTGILSRDINGALWRPLRSAVETWGRQHEPAEVERHELPTSAQHHREFGPSNFYASNRIRDVVVAVAALIVWVDLASAQITDPRAPKAPNRQPDEVRLALTNTLATIFRAIYEQEPKQTRDGPWLSFLRAALAEGGFGKITDEAARKLWQTASARHRTNNLG